MYTQAQSFLEDVFDEAITEKITFDQRMTTFYVKGANYYLEIGEVKKLYFVERVFLFV